MCEKSKTYLCTPKHDILEYRLYDKGNFNTLINFLFDCKLVKSVRIDKKISSLHVECENPVDSIIITKGDYVLIDKKGYLYVCDGVFFIDKFVKCSTNNAT